MSSCSKNAWGVTPTAVAVEDSKVEHETLADIMSSQYLHDLEMKELNRILEMEEEARTTTEIAPLHVSNDMVLDDDGFPVYDEASFLKAFEQSAVEHLSHSSTSGASDYANLRGSLVEDTTDSDLAMAMSLQEYEDKQYHLQKELNNQTGNVKVVNRDYIESLNDEDGGIACYREDLELMEGDSDGLLLKKHGRVVHKAMQHMYHKATKKGVSTNGSASRDNFATNEGVMDSRTRFILFKMIQNGTLNKLHGVLKTGKEASVYCADRGHMLDSKCRRLYESGAHAAEDEEDEEEDFVLVDDFNHIVYSVDGIANSVDVTETGNDTERVVDSDKTNNKDKEAAWDPNLDSKEIMRIKASLIQLAPYDASSVHRDSAVQPLPQQSDDSTSQYENPDVVSKSDGIVLDGDESMGSNNKLIVSSTSNHAIIIKIFLTTLNQFSNRQDYVDGDFRYHRSKFTRGNKREIISKWCEKEYRNLIRCYRSGLRCPQPLLFRQHLLLMSMVGVAEQPSCQLREYVYGTNEIECIQRLFVEVISSIYMMYHVASLVHGDLSEYNILVLDNGDTQHAYVIDFGQAVDVSHPESMSLLTRDLETILKYFNHHCGTSCKIPFDVICKQSADQLMEILTTPITHKMYNDAKLKANSSISLGIESADMNGDDDLDVEDEMCYEWICQNSNLNESGDNTTSNPTIDPSLLVNGVFNTKKTKDTVTERREQNIEIRKKVELYMKQLLV